MKVGTKIGTYWDQFTQTAEIGISRWWQNSITQSHINRIVCGQRIPGASAGFHELVRAAGGGRTFRLAVSIGCGAGAKELALVQAGTVDSFELFELSEQRIKHGRAAAQTAGVQDRMRFHLADAFAADLQGGFDLVYRNNSLHHMMDVEEALYWSRSQLNKGGIIAMDDFTGPTRFQWPDSALEMATSVRELMPPRLLANPRAPGHLLPTKVGRPDPALLAEGDPSEAADSGRIMESFHRIFPRAKVIPTGGAVYHLALNDVIGNFSQDDTPLLESLLLLDQSLACTEMNHYTVAIASR